VCINLHTHLCLMACPGSNFSNKMVSKKYKYFPDYCYYHYYYYHYYYYYYYYYYCFLLT